MAASNNISVWNARIDRSLTVRAENASRVLYEYLLPYGADRDKYWAEAIDVRSIKRSSYYDNGYQIGQYQPVGNKDYFSFYYNQDRAKELPNEFVVV